MNPTKGLIYTFWLVMKTCSYKKTIEDYKKKMMCLFALIIKKHSVTETQKNVHFSTVWKLQNLPSKDINVILVLGYFHNLNEKKSFSKVTKWNAFLFQTYVLAMSKLKYFFFVKIVFEMDKIFGNRTHCA